MPKRVSLAEKHISLNIIKMKVNFLECGSKECGICAELCARSHAHTLANMVTTKVHLIRSHGCAFIMLVSLCYFSVSIKFICSSAHSVNAFLTGRTWTFYTHINYNRYGIRPLCTRLLRKHYMQTCYYHNDSSQPGHMHGTLYQVKSLAIGLLYFRSHS